MEELTSFSSPVSAVWSLLRKLSVLVKLIDENTTNFLKNELSLTKNFNSGLIIVFLLLHFKALTSTKKKNC